MFLLLLAELYYKFNNKNNVMKKINQNDMLLIEGGRDYVKFVNGACVAVGMAATFALLSGPVGWVAEGFCAGWAFGQML